MDHVISARCRGWRSGDTAARTEHCEVRRCEVQRFEGGHEHEVIGPSPPWQSLTERWQVIELKDGLTGKHCTNAPSTGGAAARHDSHPTTPESPPCRSPCPSATASSTSWLRPCSLSWSTCLDLAASKDGSREPCCCGLGRGKGGM
jgi:hypothetical protein